MISNWRLLSFLESAGQPIRFLLLSNCLRRTPGKVVDFGQTAMRRRLLRFPFRRLVKIVKSIGILPGTLSFAGKREGREVEQIVSRSILRIEFVGVLERLIRRQIFTQFRQDGAIQCCKLKYVGPARNRAAEGHAGLLKLIELVVSQREIVLHLGRLRCEFCRTAQWFQSGFDVAVLAGDGGELRQFSSVTRIIELFANGMRFRARSLVKFLRAFEPQLTLAGIALALFSRQRHRLFCLLLPPLLAIHDPELILDGGGVGFKTGSFLKHFSAAARSPCLKYAKPR